MTVSPNLDICTSPISFIFREQECMSKIFKIKSDLWLWKIAALWKKKVGDRIIPACLGLHLAQFKYLWREKSVLQR